MEVLDFTSRAVLVTGGTRGLGAGIAAYFRDAGANVVVCGRTPPAGAAKDFVQADVRDPVQVDHVVRAVLDRLGRLDVVINNAGGAPPADAATASPRFHAKVIELNLIAPLHVAQRANAVMQEADGGCILMIGSISGVRASPGTAAYGAAKAGLHHLATSLAVEWAPKVRVNSVIVGPAGTQAAGAHYDGDEDAVAQTVPSGRLASALDVARACAYLASPLAAHVSGAALTVHGGGERPTFLRDRTGHTCVRRP